MPIKEQRTPTPSRVIGNIVLAISALFLITNFILPFVVGPQIPGVPYSLFIHQVEAGEVERVQVGQNQIKFQLKTVDNEPGTVFSTTPIFDLGLPKLLEEKGVEFAAAPPPKNAWFNSVLGWVIPPLIFVGIWQFFIRRGGGGPQGVLSIGKSKAKVYVEGESAKTTFADVAGVQEAKAELVEIVDFLKTPGRYTEIGARIPKGVLLVGPPGTGKTLLAKAVAGEAGVPFFSMSGSEFVELFVGVGSSRVRDLFEQAKKPMLCHQFRTPLNVASFSADLLKRHSHQWTEEKKCSYFALIQLGIKQISELLDEILLFGKAEAAKLEFQPREMNLNLFCNEIICQVELANSNQIPINFVTQNKSITADFDPKMLQLILTNLLSNAIKYSPENSSVILELSCEDGNIIFKIKDTGIGIPVEDRRRIFEPFYRGSNIDSIPGSGLGLSIVKTIVDLHGGEIFIESQVGVGTTFIVTLSPAMNN